MTLVAFYQRLEQDVRTCTQGRGHGSATLGDSFRTLADVAAQDRTHHFDCPPMFVCRTKGATNPQGLR